MAFLSRHLILDTRSAAVARQDAVMFRGISDYRPLGAPDFFRVRVSSALCDDVRLSTIASTGHSIRLVDDEGLTILMPHRGTIATEARAARLQARVGGLMVPRRGARRTLVGTDYVGFAIQVPFARLRRQAAANPEDAAMLLRTLDGGFPGGGPEAARLVRHLRHLIAEIDTDEGLLAAPRAARAAAGAVTELLLDCLGSTAEPAPRHAAAGLTHVARAEAVIRARLGEELSVPDLAAAVGVGTRALQLAFQAHRGASPREVIAGLRLEAARARLLAPGPADTVTIIALDCGVTHFGRFAAAYRARFGEAPSATLALAPRRG